MSQNFDRHSESYGDAVQRSIAFSGRDVGFFTDVKADLLVEVAHHGAGDPSSLSVLDVGCGVGLTDKALGGRFGSLAGVDVSEGSIGQARITNPHVDYRVYDGSRLPYGDGTYDMAFAICVIHHVEPAERATFAVEMARVVRPGGLLVAIEHNPYNPLTRLAVARCDFDEGVVLSRRNTTRKLLTLAGLDVVEARYVLFFPWRAEAFRRVERRLGWLPLGAQYVVAARTPFALDPSPST